MINSNYVKIYLYFDIYKRSFIVKKHKNILLIRKANGVNLIYIYICCIYVINKMNKIHNLLHIIKFELIFLKTYVNLKNNMYIYIFLIYCSYIINNSK